MCMKIGIKKVLSLSLALVLTATPFLSGVGLASVEAAENTQAQTVFGDADKNGTVTSSDLIGVKKAELEYSKANKYVFDCDLCSDGKINQYDSQKMRRLLIAPDSVQSDSMVLVTPWCFNAQVGSIQNDQTCEDKGYEFATLVQSDANVAARSFSMADVELAEYQSLRFAIRKTTSGWHGIQVNSEWVVEDSGCLTWIEYQLNLEDSVYVLYQNGEKTNVSLPMDANLSDLSMQVNVNVYVTEVRGRRCRTEKLEKVADCFSTKVEPANFDSTERPNAVSSGAYKIDTSWGVVENLKNLSLSQYKKVIFYLRLSETKSTSNWLEASDYFSTLQLGKLWIECKLEKNADGTWNTYFANSLCKSNLSLTNLSDIKIDSWGENSYYFSEVFAVRDEVDSDYRVIGTPFGKEGTEVDVNYMYDPIQNVKDAHTYKYNHTDWEPVGFATGITLNSYTDLLFYMNKDDMSSGAQSYLQFLKDEKENLLLTATCGWHEIHIQKNTEDSYDVYVDRVKTTTITELSQLRYAIGGDVEFMYTSLLAKTVDGVELVGTEYETIGNPIAVGTETEQYAPVSLVKDAKTYTYTASTYEPQAFANIVFDKYQSILFYLYRVNTNNTSHYVELHHTGTNQDFIADNTSERWYKVELKKLEDGVFNVYVNDTLQDDTVSSCKDLSIILNGAGVTAKYTSLLGVKDPDYGYVSSDFSAIAPLLNLSNANEVETYEAVSRVEGAKTYQKPQSLWGQYLVSSVDLNKYKELIFYCRNNSNPSTKYLVLCYDSNQLLAVTDLDWHKVQMKRQADGSYSVWVDGEKKLDSVNDISKFIFQIGDDILFEYTSILGLVDFSDYTVIGAPRTYTNAVETNDRTPISAMEDAKAYKLDNASWAQNDYFDDVDISKYTEVLFYVRRNTTDEAHWLMVRLGDTNYLLAHDNIWHEVKILKNKAADNYDVYVDGSKNNTPIAKLNDLRFIFNDGMSVSYTSMIAKTDEAMRTIVDANGTMKYSVAKYNTGYVAGEEFKTLFNQAMGKTIVGDLSWIQDNQLANHSEPLIILGDDLAVAAGYSTEGLKDHGYRIIIEGNRIYIYGKTSQGTCNGVYDFLKRTVGLRIYTGDCISSEYQEGKAVTLTMDDTTTTVNPVIAYNYDLNGETRQDENQTYRQRLNYVRDYEVMGGGSHAESDFVRSTYFTNLNEQLVNGHMPLTDTVAKAAASWLYDEHVSKYTNKSQFLFGIADDAKWYDNTEVGVDRTNQYVKFMNVLVGELSTKLSQNDSTRTISIGMMAYKNTIKAPTVELQPKDNVKMDVFYAPVEANWYKPLTDEVNDAVPVKDENTQLFKFDADTELKLWADKVTQAGGKVVLWTYHTFFTSYLTPFDCFDSMKANYQLAANVGAYGVIDNVQHDNKVSTDWNRLKVYLKSELAKNPSITDEDYNTLIDDFMKAYFGPAAASMKEAFTAERTVLANLYTEQNKVATIFSANYGGGQSATWFTTQGNHAKWGLTQKWTTSGYTYSGTLKTDVYDKMNKALTSISTAKSQGTITDTDATAYQKRVQLEMIAIRYVLLAVPEKKKPDSSNTDTFTQLATDCNNLGMTKCSEGRDGITETDLKELSGQN